MPTPDTAGSYICAKSVLQQKLVPGAVIFDFGDGAAMLGGSLHRICGRTDKRQSCREGGYFLCGDSALQPYSAMSAGRRFLLNKSHAADEAINVASGQYQAGCIDLAAPSLSNQGGT